MFRVGLEPRSTYGRVHSLPAACAAWITLGARKISTPTRLCAVEPRPIEPFSRPREPDGRVARLPAAAIRGASVGAPSSLGDALKNSIQRQPPSAISLAAATGFLFGMMFFHRRSLKQEVPPGEFPTRSALYSKRGLAIVLRGLCARFHDHAHTIARERVAPNEAYSARVSTIGATARAPSRLSKFIVLDGSHMCFLRNTDVIVAIRLAPHIAGNAVLYDRRRRCLSLTHLAGYKVERQTHCDKYGSYQACGFLLTRLNRDFPRYGSRDSKNPENNSSEHKYGR